MRSSPAAEESAIAREPTPLAHLAPSVARESPGRHAPMSIGPGPAQRAPRAKPVRLARAIAVLSGKGGVGKTNVAVNLSIAMAERLEANGRRSGVNLGSANHVCLLDADLGLANADVLCGLTPRSTLEDVVHGTKTLDEVAMTAPGGFRLVPGASGVASVANLSVADRRRLVTGLAALERSTECLVIDTAAGISAHTMAFAAAAHLALVVVTPEPTSITDAYGAIKTLAAKVRRPTIRLVVNMVSDLDEGEEVFRRIDRVSRTFLSLPLALAGVIPFDPAVRAAVRQREPLLILAPDSPAARATRAIARGLCAECEAPDVAGSSSSVVDPSAFASARSGFLVRLAGWLARR